MFISAGPLPLRAPVCACRVGGSHADKGEGGRRRTRRGASARGRGGKGGVGGKGAAGAVAARDPLFRQRRGRRGRREWRREGAGGRRRTGSVRDPARGWWAPRPRPGAVQVFPLREEASARPEGHRAHRRTYAPRERRAGGRRGGGGKEGRSADAQRGGRPPLSCHERPRAHPSTRARRARRCSAVRARRCHALGQSLGQRPLRALVARTGRGSHRGGRSARAAHASRARAARACPCGRDRARGGGRWPWAVARELFAKSIALWRCWRPLFCGACTAGRRGRPSPHRASLADAPAPFQCDSSRPRATASRG